MNNKELKTIKSIDLFAGCGGLMEGFEQSGHFETLACVEWEKAPCENIKKRLSTKWGYENADQRVLRFDIQRTAELISGWDDDNFGKSCGLDRLVGENKVDIIIGGPPCQAYSLAGRVRDSHGMKNDYRNYLFESYLKVVNHYKPKFFIFENVPGMLSAAPDGTLIIDIIKKSFETNGYKVLDNMKSAIIDLTEYGVPQNRKRVIIFGVNTEYYAEKAEEILKKFYEILKMNITKKMTVKDAIGDLPSLTPLDTTQIISVRKRSHSESATSISNHNPRFHNSRDMKTFSMLAEDLESGTKKYISADSLKLLYSERTGRKSNVHKYYVLRWDEQSNTIPAHLYKDGLRHIHPDSNQARSLTVREAARLQTFDDDYEFIGTAMDQYKMIGNAVPPKFSKVIAKVIKELLNRYN